ncbi:MAG: carboxypeptidase-like regulatory domain-containing protein [Candidatus Pseudobacter hemicellulosilyticus]|uniref:Carboxypeptidase-like regulatory domain-containing protein n=1 Tax=Candidatus Pseudobacter hemicellulosilyticus TaxID=3121375 RepID=A0AAJ5WYI5_9BACT|nr:MAG: carboxypeptidase-like regulatory domain-containing protein [Pseudobacter sp.]
MKQITFLCLLFALTGTLTAQEKHFTVLGKVVDSATGQPLAGASAYCQNTTHGAVTNAEGVFTLRLPGGGYDLVLSYTGYGKKLLRISSSQPAMDTLPIELVKQEASLEEVAVVASTEVPNGLEKYGAFFLRHFIGTTPNAAECTLTNPEALHFFYTKKRNRLKVTAKEDLLISNQALGYTIRYQLDSFSYDYNTNISQYTGFPFFIETDSTEEMTAAWKRNRARTYLGSRLHFMRALYDSTVTDEGFQVEKLNDEDLKDVKGTLIPDLYDSTLYLADSNDVTIGWSGRYRISYRKVYPDKNFLKEFKLPADSKTQITLLNVTDGFVIEQNGYFYEQYDVINTGYWAWKKLAELLPYNYEYE